MTAFFLSLWTKIKPSLIWIALLALVGSLLLFYRAKADRLETELVQVEATLTRVKESATRDLIVLQGKKDADAKVASAEIESLKATAIADATRMRLILARDQMLAQVQAERKDIENASDQELIDMINKWIEDGVL